MSNANSELVQPVWKTYSSIIIAFSSIFLFGVFILVLGAIDADILISLAVTEKTPWGIITSMFANNHIDDFILNIEGMSMFFIFFVFGDWHFSQTEKRKRSNFLVTSMFVSAIIANVLWILNFPSLPANGTSGLVYGLAGVILVFAFMNIFEIRQILGQSKYSLVLWAFNPIIIIIVLFDVALQILNVQSLFASQVNVFVHYYAFAIGFFITLIWIYARVLLTRRKAVSLKTRKKQMVQRVGFEPFFLIIGLSPATSPFLVESRFRCSDELRMITNFHELDSPNLLRRAANQ
jgi:hypothetical protein